MLHERLFLEGTNALENYGEENPAHTEGDHLCTLLEYISVGACHCIAWQLDLASCTPSKALLYTLHLCKA